MSRQKFYWLQGGALNKRKTRPVYGGAGNPGYRPKLIS